MRIGDYDKAKQYLEKSKKIIPKILEKSHSILVVEDSQAVILKLKNLSIYTIQITQ